MSKKDRHLWFLYELHKDGIEIGHANVGLLNSSGILSDEEVPHFYDNKSTYTRNQAVKHPTEAFIDQRVDVVDEDHAPADVVMDEEDHDEIVKKYQGGKEITKEDWLPHNGNVLEPNEDFIRLIDSILIGFSHRIENKQYDLYKQQSADWIAEGQTLADCEGYDEIYEFVRMERRRFKINGLYFCNKYLELKEGEVAGGHRDYEAWDCQAFVCWLIDCGFSILLGKLRQVGLTTTMGGLTVRDLICHPNYFMKFITENALKGEEIFNDKIRFAFYALPDVFRPTVANDRDRLLRFMYKQKKGEGRAIDSKCVVEAPYVTAINGGTPNKVLVDEVGQIGILGEMTNEGRPTMFIVDAKTQKMRMVRQLVMWGTGGNLDKGGAAFETEFRACMEAWKKRNFNYGVLPIFLDAFSKPSVTKEFFEREKEYYYGKKGVEAERKKLQFHQHYPVTIEDMFLRNHRTIIPIAQINEHLDRCYKLYKAKPPQKGFFEPIYDYEVEQPEASDVPFKVIGANFIPTKDDDDRACVVLLDHPRLKWTDRYYQGTDPIFTETGLSKMASTIWDEHYHAPVCAFNYRVPNYRLCYLQTLLMNLYYGQCPHLVESNIGSGLIDYIDYKGFWGTLVSNYQLPLYLQTPSGASTGINKRANTSGKIIDKLIEMIDGLGHKIQFDEFWVQLKTFSEKTLPSGKTRWEPEDGKLYDDDLIDAVVYGYICRMAFDHKHPNLPHANSGEKKTRYKMIMDDNFEMKMKKVLR